MTEILCKEVRKPSEFSPPCENIRKIKNGIIERCSECGDDATSQLHTYYGKLKSDPVKLTIEKWEWLAETGERSIYNWKEFVEISKIVGHCGFNEKNYEHNSKGLESVSCIQCEGCVFYKEKNQIGKRCFNGLNYKWKNAKTKEERKEIACKILQKIREVYREN